MSVEATIWRDENGDGVQQDGDVWVEVTGDEEMFLHFRVDGTNIASAVLDRFSAGLVVGQITAGAVEAIKA